MELHQLRYFVAVAETQSFSRAATRCHVAQPSLSQQIKKLEEGLGHRLFDRLSRGVALTEAGTALLPRARRILAEVNAVNAGISADLAGGCGPLAVGAIPTMAPYLLPPLLKRFMRRFPDCALTLREDRTERLVEALLDRELDLGILSTPIEHEGLSVQVIGREKLLLATSRGDRLVAAGKPLGVAALRDQPAVVLHEMHCLGQQIESFCSSRRVTRRIVCRSTQLDTVLHLVGLGLGISVVPEMCASSSRSKRLRFRSFGRGGPTREIAVVYRTDRTLSRLAGEFISMLRENVGSESHALAGGA
jgi:LysR family hydrogen peroxide-inducible transcriptional activator